MKVRYRITLAFVAISAVMLVILFAVTYINTISQQQKDFSRRLLNRALTVARIYRVMGSGNYELLSRVDSSMINLLGEEAVSIYNDRDERVYLFAHHFADTIPIPPTLIGDARLRGQTTETVGSKQAVAVHVTGATPVVVVVSATDIVGSNNLRELLKSQLNAFVIGLLLSLVAGWYFSRRILAPLQKVSSTVKAISATNIERRLPQTVARDEWRELTDTFNSLLERLQQSFDLQGRFIANASHELSTPLTAIQSQIDVVLNKERPNQEYKKVLEQVRSEAAHLGSLTHQLLNIARTSRGGAIQTEPVRVDELLMEIPLMLQQKIKDCEVDLHFDDLPENELLCTVNGNTELLLSAFRNIAENGCKYAPDKKVRITLSFIEKRIIVLFSNHSHPLDEAELETVFQPFQRGGNIGKIKGYGLGLSLVRRIILLHKGEIKMESADKDRVLITVILPSAA